MRAAALLAIFLFDPLFPTTLRAQEEPAPAPPREPQIPGVLYEMAPTLAPATARTFLLPPVPPLVDPRVIVFDPYFYPTHYNFRPLPYGSPPFTSGFFYDTYANPYYYQYYGPGEYYGF